MRRASFPALCAILAWSMMGSAQTAIPAVAAPVAARPSAPAAPPSSEPPPPVTLPPAGEEPAELQRLRVRPAPPDSLRNRPPLIEEEYQRKKENSYFTGLPIANSDPNSGIGFGARVYYYDNGNRGDSRFAYTPYLHRVFLQAFFSSRGLQFHWLDYDAPAFHGTPYRLRASAILGRNTLQNYFGRGEASMRPLQYAGAPGRVYDNATEYDRDLSFRDANGRTYVYYDRFELLRAQGSFSIERSLFGGLVRPFLGLGFAYNYIHDYTDDRLSAVDPNTDDEVKAKQETTRLRQDCDRGVIVGCSGGWENILRLGLIYDSRDYEPDPNRGIVGEVSTEIGTRALGSDFDFVRALGALRAYWSPFPALADVVLAGRVAYQVQTSGTPFYSMNVLPFTEDFRLGLGGSRTIRGYKQDRFVGPVMALANLELRWTVGHVQIKDQNFGLILVPFVDLGRAFDNVKSTSLRDWRRGQGGAVRVAWNQATIVMVDYGVSAEDTGLYINFNHIF